MKLLYLNEHLSCLNYQMNPDMGFAYHQLKKDDMYQINNSKSSCSLFMIEGEVCVNSGEYEGLRIMQGQMIFIPQNVEIRMQSTIGIEVHSFILGQECKCM